MVSNWSIQRGSSKIWPFLVKQDDNLTAEDLTLFTNILVRLIHIETGKLMAQYAMATLTDYNTDDFHVIDAAAGTFEIAMQSALTLNADLGEYIVQIELWKTNSDFSEGYEKQPPDDQKLFEIVDKRTE